MERFFHMFYIGLKRGFGHAERASFLFATFQGYLLVSFYLWFSSFFLRSLLTSSPLIFAIIPAFLFGALIIINSRYFVKTGRYRRILDEYGSESKFTKRKKALYLSITILLYLSSLGLLMWSGVMLSKYLNIGG